jgi:biopolymer transport protein ExbD
MTRLAARPRARAEPTIALINVVFLMLVFFLVAGQIANPVDHDVTLVSAPLDPSDAPQDVLVITADGARYWQGAVADPADFAAAQGDGPLRIMPDRDTDARALVILAAELRALAGQDVVLVTEQGGSP